MKDKTKSHEIEQNKNSVENTQKNTLFTQNALLMDVVD